MPAAQLFAELQAVVIDEVHAFCGTDRGAHLMSILERLTALCGTDVQRIGLSATVGNPAQILSWLSGTSQREGVVVDPPKSVTQRLLRVSLHDDAQALAQAAAEQAAGCKSLLFCPSRSLTETIAERMQGAGVEVFTHHSSLSKEERQAAEEKFHRGRNACIVCTSTLELGIDVGDLDRVLQADAPSTVASFLQRMGRTGRRPGQAANTWFLCETRESVLLAVALIELAREGWVESVPVQTRCWPVLVHQLLALTLAQGAVSAERCWQILSRVPDFCGIKPEEYFALIEHMKRADFLFESGGLLSMGDRAERVFGRRNFQELYAVFSSPLLYRVLTREGRDIGSLEQSFVDRLVEEMSAFLLGGRAWTVTQIEHKDRVLRVQPAPRGKRPSWGGFLPQLLGFELCQRVRRILTEDIVYPYVERTAMEALAAWRTDLGPLLKHTDGVSRCAVQLDESAARVWTFAGGRINHTLKYVLEWQTGWRVVADNFLLRIEGDGLSHEAVKDAISRISVPAFWQDPATSAALLSRVPPFRLSKFQPALPDVLAQEVLASYLLDIQGTLRFLSVGSA